MLYNEFAFGHGATLGYILAHEEVMREHEHGMRFSLDPKLNRELADLVKSNIMDAALTLAGLNLRWSKMVKCVTTFKAARMVLNDGMAKVEELHHHGALGETEKEKLMVLMKEQARCSSHT